MTYPICRALIRPNLLMGAQYMPAILLITICAVLFSTWVVRIMGVSVVVLVVGFAVLRMMAKADPQMIEVYLQHLRYSRAHLPQPDV